MVIKVQSACSFVALTLSEVSHLQRSDAKAAQPSKFIFNKLNQSHIYTCIYYTKAFEGDDRPRVSKSAKLDHNTPAVC